MPSLKHRLAAMRTLQEGGIIACPTEAVWGYSCDPWSQPAVQHLLRLKRRDPRKGLILVASHERQVMPLLESLTWDLRERLMAHWPGPHTFLLPDPDEWVPAWVKGNFPKVAVRVSAHPVVRQLCDAWGGPLVSTSANRQGRPPARTEAALRHAVSTLEKSWDRPYVVPGRTGGLAQPTQIRDLVSGVIVRPG